MAPKEKRRERYKRLAKERIGVMVEVAHELTEGLPDPFRVPAFEIVLGRLMDHYLRQEERQEERLPSPPDGPEVG